MTERPPAASPPIQLVALEPLIEQLARRIVELQHEHPTKDKRPEERSPWMSLARAADYLDWPKQRLYKLTAQGAIPHYKHEGRLLFHQDELNTWLTHYAQGAER